MKANSAYWQVQQYRVCYIYSLISIMQIKIMTTAKTWCTFYRMDVLTGSHPKEVGPLAGTMDPDSSRINKKKSQYIYLRIMQLTQLICMAWNTRNTLSSSTFMYCWASLHKIYLHYLITSFVRILNILFIEGIDRPKVDTAKIVRNVTHERQSVHRKVKVDKCLMKCFFSPSVLPTNVNTSCPLPGVYANMHWAYAVLSL